MTPEVEIQQPPPMQEQVAVLSPHAKQRERWLLLFAVDHDRAQRAKEEHLT